MLWSRMAPRNMLENHIIPPYIATSRRSPARRGAASIIVRDRAFEEGMACTTGAAASRIFAQIHGENSLLPEMAIPDRVISGLFRGQTSPGLLVSLALGAPMSANTANTWRVAITIAMCFWRRFLGVMIQAFGIAARSCGSRWGAQSGRAGLGRNAAGSGWCSAPPSAASSRYYPGESRCC